MIFICKRQTCIVEADLIGPEFKKDEDSKLIRFNLKAHTVGGLWVYDEVLKINLNDTNLALVWDIHNDIGKMVFASWSTNQQTIDTEVIRTNIFKRMKEKYAKN